MPHMIMRVNREITMVDIIKLQQRQIRENYEAFTAMRNDINELIGNMDSQESTLRYGPEMSHECAAVVEAVRRYVRGN